MQQKMVKKTVQILGFQMLGQCLLTESEMGSVRVFENLNRTETEISKIESNRTKTKGNLQHPKLNRAESEGDLRNPKSNRTEPKRSKTAPNPIRRKFAKP